MKSFTHILKLSAVLVVVLAVPSFAASQDLGSTSGIFKTKKKKVTKKAKPKPKKTTSKRNSASKTKRTRKKSTKSTASRSKRSASQRRKSVRKKPVRKSNRSNTASRKKKNVTITKSKTNVVKKATPGTSAVAVAQRKRVAEDVVITYGKPPSAEVLASFEDNILDGNASRNRRLYGQAEQAYKQARINNPSDSRAIYGLGNVYSDQQRWEEAEKAYRAALKLEPDSSLANIALSYVLTQPVAGSSISDRYIEAEAFARKAIELDESSALGYDQLGVALELRGLIGTETENSFRKAIALDPTFALAHAHLGRLLRKQGRTGESSASYREAIKLAANVPTMILVANVMQSQQRYLDSERLLREALRRDPRNPTGLYLLGKALTTRRSFDEAETVLRKGVDVSPKSFMSHALLGSMYTRSGDYSRAEQSLLLAMTVASNNEKVYLAREFEEVGDGFAKVNKASDAERVYRRALFLDEASVSIPSKIRRLR